MKLRLFGGLDISRSDGEGIRFAARKSAYVLAVLVLAGPKGIRRDILCDLLWSGRGAQQARASLRQALVELRHAIAAETTNQMQIQGDADWLVLSSPIADIDVWRFDHLLAEDGSSSLGTAATLWTGELLAGVDLPESATAWVLPLRVAYTRKALRLVDQLSKSEAAGTPALSECETLAERLLLADPAAEEAHRALIRIYKKQGKTSLAARQFKTCTAELQMALGVAPDRETMGLANAPSPHSKMQEPDLSSQDTSGSIQPSVAVMPFDSLSGPEDHLLADGFAEEITAALSRTRDFFVIAQQTAFASQSRYSDLRQLGRELGIRYAVQGKLQRMRDDLRLTVKLLEAETGALVWTERYDGVLADLFALQDRVAEEVAGAMHPALLQAEIAATRRKPPGSLKAYEFVLQAQAKMWRRTEHENREAIQLLGQAITIDPCYGRALALLAWCHSQNVVYLWSLDSGRERELIRAAIDAAAPLIGNDPFAMTALGAALGQSLGELDRARSYIDEALALDPNNAWAWARRGWIIIQYEEFEAAMTCFERAIRLSPLDPILFNFRFGIAACLGHMEQYGEAAKMLKELLNLHPDVAWGHRMLAAFAALAGDIKTARSAVIALQKTNPLVSIARMKLDHPGRNTPGIFNRLLKGWRLAGLPEGE